MLNKSLRIVDKSLDIPAKAKFMEKLEAGGRMGNCVASFFIRAIKD